MSESNKNSQAPSYWAEVGLCNNALILGIASFIISRDGESSVGCDFVGSRSSHTHAVLTVRRAWAQTGSF